MPRPSPMRRCAARIVLLLALAAGAWLAAPAPAGALCGDADGNGQVTLTDGVQTLRAAAGLPSSCTPERCDVDGGGSTTLTDGVNVLRSAAGLSAPSACPGSGPNPTPTGPTPGPGACTAAIVTLALESSLPVGAARLTLDYPEASVSLPGSGADAAARTTALAPLFGDGRPNDQDDRLLVSVVAPAGVGSDLLSVRFDCLGAAPGPSAFACTLAKVVGTDGSTPVNGARCTVRVATE